MSDEDISGLLREAININRRINFILRGGIIELKACLLCSNLYYPERINGSRQKFCFYCQEVLKHPERKVSKCRVCGKDLCHKIKTAVFCGKDCRSIEDSYSRYLKNIKHKHCIICGREFVIPYGSTSKRKVCDNKECYKNFMKGLNYKWREENASRWVELKKRNYLKYKAKKQQKTCVICNSTFETIYRQAKTCSKECSKINARNKWADNWKRSREKHNLRRRERYANSHPRAS